MTRVYIGYIQSIYPVSDGSEEIGVERDQRPHMKKVLFNLSEEQYEELGKLAKQMGISRSEALRRAMELYAIVKKAKAEGDEIRKHTKGGEEVVMEVLG